MLLDLSNIFIIVGIYSILRLYPSRLLTVYCQHSLKAVRRKSRGDRLLLLMVLVRLNRDILDAILVVRVMRLIKLVRNVHR